jgi:uncharacterized protein (DUF885 family)
VTPERAVDAHSEDYVERYCALDPITATYIGVAGHDHELPDLSPDGFAAREELTRSAYAAVRDATPVDEREGVPGHHLQVGQTAVRKDLLNRWQRLMCWVSGHGEGWARL